MTRKIGNQAVKRIGLDLPKPLWNKLRKEIVRRQKAGELVVTISDVIRTLITNHL